MTTGATMREMDPFLFTTNVTWNPLMAKCEVFFYFNKA